MEVQSGGGENTHTTQSDSGERPAKHRENQEQEEFLLSGEPGGLRRELRPALAVMAGKGQGAGRVVSGLGGAGLPEQAPAIGCCGESGSRCLEGLEG